VYDVASQVGGSLEEACDDDAPRQRIFRALLDELTAGDRPTILCLEDLHWADEATLDLLGFLASRLRHSHVMLVVTYRNDGLAPDHPLRMTLGELGTQTAVRRVDLPPLSRATVSALARRAGVGAYELFELTAGNPFLVTEVLEAGTHEVPPSVRDAVLARAARLPADARAALDACAVIGSRIDVDLLTKVAECDTAAIDGCLTAGALVSDSGGFRFRHEIARRTVEEALPAHRRAALNQRALDVLVAAGAEDGARLAHHADAAGDADAVLRFAPVAARQAAILGAHREAATQYARALRFVDDRRTHAELLSAFGAERALTDHWQDAAEAQEEALALWEELGEQRLVGDLMRQMARTMWRLCRGDEALAMAERAVTVLEPLGPSVELGWAYAVLGAFRNGTGADSRELLAKGEALAVQFDDKSLLSNVVNSIGCSKPGVEGAPDLRRALAIALEAGDDAEAGRAFTNLQATLGNEYHLAEAEAIFHEGMAYCADHDIGTYEHCLRGSHGGVLDRMGRWDEADELLTFDLTERELSPVNKISKLVVLGVLDARRGRPTAAAILDEALIYAKAGLEPAYILEASTARLEAAWLAGDAEAARHEAERGAPVSTTHDDWYSGAFAAWVRRCGLPALDIAPVAPPYELLLGGDWQGAADAWRRLGVPYEEGLALLDSGEPEAMQEAVRIFERLGAVATVARAQAILRRHGIAAIPRGRRAETRANRFGLTRREQEVLALIGEGLTNAEIGARLFIAEKTVDNHVSSVLAKMNVESRRDAARLARESELAAI
jgi:DNA-binding CsgD family transcriptional regulator/tetratricopeptide (TPR) repeat protein